MNIVAGIFGSRGWAALAAALLFSVVALAKAGEQAGAAPAVLEEWDIHVTTGAAAGYVPDDTCAMCHSDKAESFKDVGMAKSFYRPSPDKVIEDFENNHFLHEGTGRHYEMELRGDEYWFRRYRLAPDGAQVDVIEQKVDWILGSGHHSRVYLYQTADGEMFQLPLAWYSQDGKWAMSPGFEYDTHLGLQRKVRRRCMFCHNAFPEVPAGSDRLGMPETFPSDLPQGIGCQRCHGPGAEHVRLALGGEAPLDQVHEAIVNPADLPRERLYSICYGCHMQPAVAVPASRVMGRDAYSFRPGQALEDFIVQLEMEDPTRPASERFEINHHPYRLEQSSCFIESGGALGCLTCHDPHRKIPAAERAEHYRSACLSCHETDDEGLPVMQSAQAASHPAISPDADCTACHMPARRTQDVVNVWMTDHRIVRDPGPDDLLAPIAKEAVTVSAVELKDPHAGLSHAEALIYKTMGVLNYTSRRAGYAADALEKALEEDPTPHFEPWMELAESRAAVGNYAAAIAPAIEAQRLAPGHPEIEETLALARYMTGSKEEGLRLLEELIADNPDLAESRLNLALLLAGEGDMDAALAQARKAAEQRHTLWQAWRLIGEIGVRAGDAEMAADAFLTALSIEPDAPRVRQQLILVLDRLGRAEDAELHRSLLRN